VTSSPSLFRSEILQNNSDFRLPVSISNIIDDNHKKMTMSSTRMHTPLLIAYVSALSFCCLQLKWIWRDRHHEQDAVSEGDDNNDNAMEIHFMPTYRNRKIVSRAIGLHIQPWGFGNCHFATFLAQIRPSPFLIHRGIATRKVSLV
jgi:hypothetical protein